MNHPKTISADNLINEFVKHYNQLHKTNLTITEWPDKKERNKPACDALAESNYLTLAIEHTTIDSFLNHRADNDRFIRAVGSLEKELKDKFQDRITLTIAIDSIQTGIDWDIIKINIRVWLIENVPRLPFGNQERWIEDVPFPIQISKSKCTSPGLFVSRFAPENLEDQMAKIIRRALESKNGKLGVYKNAGNYTLLLIESDDIALLDVPKVRSALKTAIESGAPSGNIDEIWFADTSISQKHEFYLLFKK